MKKTDCMLVLIEPNDLMFATLFFSTHAVVWWYMNYIDAEINPDPPKSR